MRHSCGAATLYMGISDQNGWEKIPNGYPISNNFNRRTSSDLLKSNTSLLKTPRQWKGTITLETLKSLRALNEAYVQTQARCRRYRCRSSEISDEMTALVHPTFAG